MFNHILVSLDGSSLAECVLPHAVSLARAFGSQVTLLRVLEHSRANRAGVVDLLEWHMSKAEANAYLDNVAAHLQRVDVPTERVLLEGQAAESIIEYTRGHDIDLILLSSHGRSGLSRWNVSSVVQKVILRAHTGIMLVRAYQPLMSDLLERRYRRILLPLDCSQRADYALPLANTLSRFYQSQLLLAHVVPEPILLGRTPLNQQDVELSNRIIQRNRLVAAEYLEQCQFRLSVDTQTRLLVGNNVGATLHELAEEQGVDLVILTAHGCSGVTKWPYGGVALGFICYGTTPLLVVQDLSSGEIQPSLAEVAATEVKGH